MWIPFCWYGCIQSPSKPLEWQGLFLCFCCTLKTFEFQIKRIWDMNSEFQLAHLDVLNISGYSTCCLNPPIFKVTKNTGTCDWQVFLVAQVLPFCFFYCLSFSLHSFSVSINFKSFTLRKWNINVLPCAVSSF